jgi:glyoxylase-like metal-dependent hydrolase (beta-lactamase superfamily II)
MQLDFSTPDTLAFVRQITTDSLGDHSYIVVVGDEAVAIDIQRDLERFEAVLDGIDARLVGVFETHIHNDYVSGGKRLADAHAATYVLPAGTGAPYDHLPLVDGGTFRVGGWAIRAMRTPGHTFNHTSYVLESPDGPVAIFSGGSMLVGAVGRSDLLGPDHTEELLALQYASAHRIADELPDPSVVAPTHGTGSFCSASDVADTTSTIERERLQNPALLAPTLEAFAFSQVIGYKQFPAYYRYMAPANLAPTGAPPDRALPEVGDLDEVGGATVVDVRPFAEYAAGHLPGSINVEVSNDDAVYLGWTLPWGDPLVLVGNEKDAEAVRLHLQRIGWDDVVGRVDPDRLGSLGVPLATTGAITFADLDPESAGVLVDVRDPVEHRDGVIDGAVPVHLADFAADPLGYGGDEVIIHCQSGYRATVAAGFAEAAGATVTVVTDDIKNYPGTLVTPPT